VTGSCECGNEPSDSIKCRKFLGLTSQEGLCSVELVVVRLNTFHEIINSAVNRSFRLVIHKYCAIFHMLPNTFAELPLQVKACLQTVNKSLEKELITRANTDTCYQTIIN
jgi:hypothetical protein